MSAPIASIDRARRLLTLGQATIWLVDGIDLDGLREGMHVTISGVVLNSGRLGLHLTVERPHA